MYERDIKRAQDEKAKLEGQGTADKNSAQQTIIDKAGTFITDILGSILTSTVGINRFKLRASFELMVGGKQSSTPWYLTLGNPYSPWLSTNHIVVKSGSIDTSTEMGFNDQPQTITVTFNCQFSRALGKQELMRMFNNSYRRTYSVPPKGSALDSAMTDGSSLNFSHDDSFGQNPTPEQSTQTVVNPFSKTPGQKFAGIDTSYLHRATMDKIATTNASVRSNALAGLVSQTNLTSRPSGG
jgi:hypothetical protein